MGFPYVILDHYDRPCFATLPFEYSFIAEKRSTPKRILVAFGRDYPFSGIDDRAGQYTLTHGLEFNPDELSGIGCNRQILEKIEEASNSYLSENLEGVMNEKVRAIQEFREASRRPGPGGEDMPSTIAGAMVTPPITIPPLQVTLSLGNYVPDRAEYEPFGDLLAKTVAALLSGKKEVQLWPNNQDRKPLSYGILSMVTPWKYSLSTEQEIGTMPMRPINVRFGDPIPGAPPHFSVVQYFGLIEPKLVKGPLPTKAREYGIEVVEAFLRSST